MTWAEIPTANVLQDIDPSSSALYNPNHPSTAPWNRTASGTVNVPSMSGLVTPWCGACFDETLCRLELPLGGGHGDSANNGSYYLDLLLDVPQFVMRAPPSGSVPRIAGGLPAGSTAQGSSFLLDDGLESSGVYADGRPRAIHSYRKHIFVPGTGVVMVIQGGTFSSAGESSKATWVMDEAGDWEYKSSPSPLPSSSSGGSATYDAGRGCAYFMLPGTSGLWKLNLSTWAWSWPVFSITNSAGDVYARYVDELDLIVLMSAGYASNIKCVNPTTWAVTTPTTTTAPLTFHPSMGIDWVPSLGCLVVCPNTGGSVYTLTPPASGAATGEWTWDTLATTGTPPGTSTNGLFGRFGYSSTLGGLYRMHSATAKPYFLPLE